MLMLYSDILHACFRAARIRVSLVRFWHFILACMQPGIY